jgi:hypothetical protein
LGVLEQGHGNFTGTQAFPHVANQQVDDRGSAERPGHFLTKRRQAAHQFQT